MQDERLRQHTVYVLDNDLNVRDSISRTLRDASYQVELFSDAQECLDRTELAMPACIVVDLLLPGMTGLRFCEKMKARSNCAFVMISGHGDLKSAVESMKLGAVDFLEKPFNRQALLSAVNDAVEIGVFRQKQIAEEQAIMDKLSRLSRREREVLDLLSDGLASKQIAVSLSISPKTVDVHRSNLSQKLSLDHEPIEWNCLAVERGTPY